MQFLRSGLCSPSGLAIQVCDLQFVPSRSMLTLGPCQWNLYVPPISHIGLTKFSLLQGLPGATKSPVEYYYFRVNECPKSSRQKHATLNLLSVCFAEIMDNFSTKSLLLGAAAASTDCFQSCAALTAPNAKCVLHQQLSQTQLLPHNRNTGSLLSCSPSQVSRAH